MSTLASKFKWLYLNSRVYLAYGTLKPRVVRLAKSEHQVAVNPEDSRARKKLIANGVRGKVPRNQKFWRSACNQLNPCVAIDVGVNFGECLFSVNYNSSERIRAIGIEANPELIPHLQASRQMHRDADLIEIHAALADETNTGTSEFYIDRMSSGGSTAAKVNGDLSAGKYEKVEVARVRLDDLLQAERTRTLNRPVVLKVDVEGYEMQVLKGLQQTMHSDLDLVGMIEFDENLLKAAGTDPASFWSFLQRYFSIYLFRTRQKAIDASGTSYHEIRKDLSSQKFHTDLLLVRVKSPQKYDDFLDQWL